MSDTDRDVLDGINLPNSRCLYNYFTNTNDIQIQILSDADRDRDVLSDKCWMKSISSLGDVYTITSKSYTLPLIHDICFI